MGQGTYEYSGSPGFEVGEVVGEDGVPGHFGTVR